MRELDRALHVELVPALFHPWRLQVVRGMRKLRVTDQCSKSSRANLTTANVLVSIQLGTVRRLTVVVVDHDKLLEANLSVKLFNHTIKLIKIRHLHASAPEVC